MLCFTLGSVSLSWLYKCAASLPADHDRLQDSLANSELKSCPMTSLSCAALMFCLYFFLLIEISI